MYNETESEDYYLRRTARADAGFDLFIEWASIAAVVGTVIYLLLRC
jgi:hypothetical protein